MALKEALALGLSVERPKIVRLVVLVVVLLLLSLLLFFLLVKALYESRKSWAWVVPKERRNGGNQYRNRMYFISYSTTIRVLNLKSFFSFAMKPKKKVFYTYIPACLPLDM